MSLRILVVPVFKRAWLYHACTDGSSFAASTSEVAQPRTPSDHLKALGQRVNARVNDVIRSQWQALQAAREGTIQHRVFQLAQGVLSREDPTEVFLRSVPSDTQHVEVIYPASLSERLVRRRLRMLSEHGTVHHHRRLVGWSVVTLPQLPLLITPLPNLTLYYSVYRVLSHWQASLGAAALRRAFRKLDAVQMHRLLSGGVLRTSEHLTLQQLPAEEDEYHRRIRLKQADHLSGLRPAPVFVGSQQLDDLVRPMDRWHTPLPDDVARQLGPSFRCGDLLDQVHRMRRSATSGAAMA